MPSVLAIAAHPDDIEFLFVTNDPTEKIKHFKNNNEYTFPVYQVVSSPVDVLQTTSIPRTLLIDKTGEIIIDKSGAVDWFQDEVQNQIKELLEN